MRPRIFHELSATLVRRLEEGLRGDDGERDVRVLLCHPLDLQDQHEPGASAGENPAVALYLTSVAPDTRYRSGGLAAELDPVHLGRVHIAAPPLWVRVRYVVLLAGGEAEELLGVLAAVLQTLHAHAQLRITLEAPPASNVADAAEIPEDMEDMELECPLRLLAEADHDWRDLGLREHRPLVSFEVTVPIPAADAATVEPIRERELQLEEQ